MKKFPLFYLLLLSSTCFAQNFTVIYSDVIKLPTEASFKISDSLASDIEKNHLDSTTVKEIFGNLLNSKLELAALKRTLVVKGDTSFIRLENRSSDSQISYDLKNKNMILVSGYLLIKGKDGKYILDSKETPIKLYKEEGFVTILNYKCDIYEDFLHNLTFWVTSELPITINPGYPGIQNLKGGILGYKIKDTNSIQIVKAISIIKK